MMRPEGYRKTIRLMNLANKFNIPIISFIDTPGAYPGVGAEERGQAEAIAKSIECCMELSVPTLAIIIGEGGSGGAIALASSNKVIMLENAIYSVISPEGCATILWRDPKKMLDAAKAMKLSAKDSELKEKITDKFLKSREDRIKILGEMHSKEIEKRIFLQSIDLNWKSHIQYLEQLRQVIGLRSYGQRDPLVEYKKEAFELFSNLLEKLKLDYVTILMNLKVETQSDQLQNTQKKIQIEENPKCLLILNNGKKISRNERCEATGKKFKNCCGVL